MAVLLGMPVAAKAQGPLKKLRQLVTEHAEKTSVSPVPLQPFTMDEPAQRPNPATESRGVKAVITEPMRVAYYVPRAETVAPPPESRPEEDHEREEIVAEPRYGGPTVSGDRAVLRNGVAYAPERAPENVKNAIWAVNSLRNKPYIWGGGHRSFYDRGYDCSGSVSYALHYAGLLSNPLPSSDLMRYGERGRGRWITVYARSGHTFAVIAGLRLDTTDLRDGGDVGPRWYADGRNTRGFKARHPAGW